MKDKNNNNSLLCQKQPWDSNDNSIWLASTVGFHRNIEKYNFPSKLSNDRKKQIISLTSKELLASPLLNKPKLYKAEEMSHIEKEYLVEHYLSPDSFHEAHSGEAFIVDESGEFLLSLNVKDHIYLQLTDTKGELETVWNKLVKIESGIGKALNFSYSPRFGFLTADPTQCGTGLLVYIYLQLPALLHTDKLEDILEKYGDESIAITGLQGDPNELIGDILAVHNNYTLGLTEENILSSLRTFITKMIVEEKAERTRIQAHNNAEIKDRVARAYGILIHSYQIEAIEALNALSLLKLGIEVGWMSGLSMAQLNEIAFQCRRAHLMCEFDQKISQEEVYHKRAEFIHKSLKNLALKI